MTTAENPIRRYGGKETEQYRYFSQDVLRHRERQWISIFLQCQPIVERSDVYSVLEFGGGRDITRAICRHYGIRYTSVDVSDRFYPDVVSSIEGMQSVQERFDMVVSFQTLEHNPFEELDRLISKMLEYSRRYLYISLPYNGAWLAWSVSVRLPKISWAIRKCWTACGFGGRVIDVSRFRSLEGAARYSPHWWEVGRPGFGKRKIIERMERHGLKLVEQRHNPMYPHHWFVLLEKNQEDDA